MDTQPISMKDEDTTVQGAPTLAPSAPVAPDQAAPAPVPTATVVAVAEDTIAATEVKGDSDSRVPVIDIVPKTESVVNAANVVADALLASGVKPEEPTAAPAPTRPKRPLEGSSSEGSSSDSSSDSSSSDSSSDSDSSSSSSDSSDSSDSSSSSSSDSDSSDSSSDSSDSDSSDSSDSSSDSSDSDDSDAPRSKRSRSAPSKSKTKIVKKSNSSSSSSSKKSSSSKGSLGVRVGDVVVNPPSEYERKEDLKPLEPSKGANKWWLRTFDKNVKWETLEHNGILFAPAYEPHGVRMLYDGVPVELTPEQEEVATFYAAMLESDYLSNEKFNSNFFADWKQLLGSGHTIKSLAKCDFTPIKKHLDAERERKAAERKTPEFKAAAKATKAELDSIYGCAIVDGFREAVGNYKVEIPGLFRGRGGHPKTGKIKKRVMPEDVILNIGPKTPIPKCPLEGHEWKGVIHNNKVTWLAYYKDPITNGYKYVYLASSSRFKGESDRQKYNKARLLIKHIDSIRASYTADMGSRDTSIRQRATAVYLIDKLALRVGNEKDTSEEADTVGCCSLRVEHLDFKDGNRVVFDFLGKDSMRYFNEVEVPELVFTNLRDFCKNKRPAADVFDALTTSNLNDHLKSFMPGLSAKVFRTYNASITLERELRAGSNDVSIDDLVSVKEQFYTNANREVAILCNHQRSLPKGHETQMATLNDNIAKVQAELKALKGKGDTFGDKKLPTDPKKRKDAIVRVETRLKNMETKRAMKDENKTVALGTSKINYMDPRITVAWCKEKDIPIEKIFNRSLLSKFPWAMEIASTWRFDDPDDPELRAAEARGDGDGDDDEGDGDGEGEGEEGGDEDEE